MSWRRPNIVADEPDTGPATIGMNLFPDFLQTLPYAPLSPPLEATTIYLPKEERQFHDEQAEFAYNGWMTKRHSCEADIRLNKELLYAVSVRHDATAEPQDARRDTVADAMDIDKQPDDDDKSGEKSDVAAMAALHASIATSKQQALDFLLEAFFARLGCVIQGWTRYSQKMTVKACTMVREILAKGDEETGLPIEAFNKRAEWEAKVKEIKWWFVETSIAVDFLSAHGIGRNRFGSGVVKIENLRYSREGGTLCLERDHEPSLKAWNENLSLKNPEHYPPVPSCGCVELRLLIKFLAAGYKWAAPHLDATQQQFWETLGQLYRLANPPGQEGTYEGPMSFAPEGASNPIDLTSGGQKFEISWWQAEDRQRGTMLRGFRVEGRFAELLDKDNPWAARDLQENEVDTDLGDPWP